MGLLTEKQEAILDYMRTIQAERGIPPSTRDIQRQFGYESQNAAMNHLRALARKGAIEQIDGRMWGLKVKTLQTQLFAIPLYGTIPAGKPVNAEEELGETLQVDPTLFGVPFGSRRRLWALRVSGDSMINAHILAGDIAVLEKREARAGEIIAALVDDTTVTLKRLLIKKGRAILAPENPKYPQIVPQHGLECQGVLVGVIRREFPLS